MKKVFIFSLISLVFTITSLSYVNYALLSDSSVSVSNSSENVRITSIGFLPSVYSSPRFSDDYTKAIFLCNDLLYLFDFSKGSYDVLGELSFVKDAHFINDVNILYVLNAKNGISINVYNLESKSSYKLGYLSYKYFTNLSDVEVVDNNLSFTVNYRKDGTDGKKSYVYVNDKLKSKFKSSNVINDLRFEDNYIYTTDSYNTYINNALFTYKDNSQFTLVGKDFNDVIYLQNMEDVNNLVSIKISENIEILDEYSLDNISFNDIMCTDSIYLIGDNFAYDIQRDEKYLLNTTANILLPLNGEIYYESNGEVFKQSDF